MIPTQLNEIAEFLKTNPYHLSQPLQDGRLNSSINEEEILNTIKDYFPIQLPKAREWWDFSFEENDIFYPVNIKTTTSVKLNEWIYQEGTITHFFELGDQKIFPNAMPNCVIFRFCKHNFSRITNDGLQFLCKKGILYFLNRSYTQKLSEVFKVKVGAVSGCDKIFKNETYGNVEFVTSITKRTNVLEKMVFVNEPNDYLLQHKDSLMQRKIKKFNENNWFEWGRMHHISPKKRIYVNAKTRQKNPFFIHQCPNYDGSILALFPYNQNLDLQNLCDKLNAINWQELGFVCGGRFLFSQRSLENALLPKNFLN